jgi:hypothetical protein
VTPVALLVGVIAGALVTISNLIFWTILQEVNQREDSSRKFHWWLVKYQRSSLFREHERLYPDSPIRRYWWLSLAFGFFLVIICIGLWTARL